MAPADEPLGADNDDKIIPERKPNVSDARLFWNDVRMLCFVPSDRGGWMNGFFWSAIAFAIAGILALITGSFWGGPRKTDPDFGAVVGGLILLVVSEGIAIVLAVIGFVVKAV